MHLQSNCSKHTSSSTELMFFVKPITGWHHLADSRMNFRQYYGFYKLNTSQSAHYVIWDLWNSLYCYKILNHIIKKHKKTRYIFSLDLLLFQRHLMSYIYIAPFPPPKHFTVFTYRNVSHHCWNAAIWLLPVPSSEHQQFETENIYQHFVLLGQFRTPICKLPTCAIKKT